MSYQHRGITLPEEVRESIDRYVVHGIPTGGFLEACINNDLADAVARADNNNLRVIPAIVGYLYNECPSACWGHSTAFSGWLDRKRQERVDAEEAERRVREAL